MGEVSFGQMRREQLALRLAMTFHQLPAEAEWVTNEMREVMISDFLPVAEMAIHEILGD